MKRWIWIALVLQIACNGPSPHFAGASVTRVTVEGSVFDVRMRGNLAETIRVNSEYALQLGPIRHRAGYAMAQVTGCQIEHVLGDAAMQLGLLNCGPGAPDWNALLRQGTGTFSCIEFDQWTSTGLNSDYAEFECDPIY